MTKPIYSLDHAFKTLPREHKTLSEYFVNKTITPWDIADYSFYINSIQNTPNIFPHFITSSSFTQTQPSNYFVIRLGWGDINRAIFIMERFTFWFQHFVQYAFLVDFPFYTPNMEINKEYVIFVLMPTLEGTLFHIEHSWTANKLYDCWDTTQDQGEYNDIEIIPVPKITFWLNYLHPVHNIRLFP